MQTSMISDMQRKLWEKQHYKIVGNHSAVKTCGWTKNMIKGEGGCYKLTFYGIMSNQCMQMSTSMSCANRCTFCWRDEKAPVSKEWKWETDDPDFIFEKSKEAHQRLLEGYGGYEKRNKGAFEKSKIIKHVALSLTGEPIMYPRINELIERFHKDGVSTFLVTNAQYPEQIKNLKPITQLYISLDAATKDLLKEVDKPLFLDYWERLNKSLKYMKRKKQRTCIRLTMIKGINMKDAEDYAMMIKKADPDFIEVKAYVFVGASRERLEMDNMPLHEEVVEFSRILNKYLDEYDLASEHIPSRVVLLAKKKFKKNNEWYTWIDFKKFHELALSGKEFSTEDYLLKTPKSFVGISGRGTADYTKERKLAKDIQ